MRSALAPAVLAVLVLLGCVDSGLDTSLGRQDSDTSRAQTAELDAAFAAADELYKAGNYEAAFPEFQRLAEEDHAGAQNRLGYIYERALVVPRDDEQAISWYRKAAKQGRLEAQSRLTYLLRNTREGYHWLREAATGGDTLAQEELGAPECYGPEAWPGEWKPTSWFLERAESGDPRAQAEMGYRLYTGRWTEPDESEALRWSLLSAEGGELTAVYVLGLIYTYGSDNVRDPFLGTGWFREAADQGYLPAMPHLGLAYLEGRGALKSLVDAYMWFRLLSDEPVAWNPDIPRSLAAEQMTPAEIEQAQSNVLAWAKRNSISCPGFRPIPVIQPAPPPR